MKTLNATNRVFNTFRRNMANANKGSGGFEDSKRLGNTTSIKTFSKSYSKRKRSFTERWMVINKERLVWKISYKFKTSEPPFTSLTFQNTGSQRKLHSFFSAWVCDKTERSVVTPTQEIEYLGMFISSREMTLSLLKEKMENMWDYKVRVSWPQLSKVSKNWNGG